VEEEHFHFGFWAMAKSPLMIGGVMDSAQIPVHSLEVMRNKEVIDINQDPLATAARLVARYTEEEWDVWAGELSGGRKVLGVANWKNETQTVNVDLRLAGVASATTRDVWAHADSAISGVETFELKAHELRLLVLSDIEAVEVPSPSGAYYSVENAVIEGGSARLVECGAGECLPNGVKVGNIDRGANVTFSDIEAPVDGSDFVGIDFINYDYHHTIGDWESNTRNMTVAVNDETPKRWAFPLAGGDWTETGRLTVELDGFVKGGANKVVFGGVTPNRWAPDLVGFEFLQ
jgi:alpha-galactosidase